MSIDIINIISNPLNPKITGKTGEDIITIWPFVTEALTIDGLGGGDIITILSFHAQDTVVYHSNDIAYTSISTGLQTIDAGSASLIDLRGVTTKTDPHVGPVISGFDVLDLTVTGTAETLISSHTVRIDALGVDIFTGGSKNPLTGTYDTMVINDGPLDTINKGAGWTQHADVVIGGITYDDFTSSLLQCGEKETVTLLIKVENIHTLSFMASTTPIVEGTASDKAAIGVITDAAPNHDDLLAVQSASGPNGAIPISDFSIINNHNGTFSLALGSNADLDEGNYKVIVQAVDESFPSIVLGTPLQINFTVHEDVHSLSFAASTTPIVEGTASDSAPIGTVTDSAPDHDDSLAVQSATDNDSPLTMTQINHDFVITNNHNGTFGLSLTSAADLDEGSYSVVVQAVDENSPFGLLGDPLTVNFTVLELLPVANPDTFNMVGTAPLDDTVDSTVLTLGNVLKNDTNPDTDETLSVVQSSFVSQTFAGSGLAGLNASAATTGSMSVVSLPLTAGEIANFQISPTGILSNEPSPVPADLIIYADGSVTLVKNNAFDFLPAGETLDLQFSYGITDSDDLGETPVNSTFDVIITGTDTNDVFAPDPSVTVTGGLGNDTIYGAGPGQGNTAIYNADALGAAARTFIGDPGAPTPPDTSAEAMLAVAQAAIGGTLFNYNFSLQSHPLLFGGNASGIVIQGVNAGAIDGTDLIYAALGTIVNTVTTPTANSTSSVDLISFGDPHVYQLYNGAVDPTNNEWIQALLPDAGQEGALMIGGELNNAGLGNGASYYVIVGSAGNDIIIGGDNVSSTYYGYFVLGEGGNNVLIGGNNTASSNYYVCATDNALGGYGVPSGQAVGDSILIGGNNTGAGHYYMLGAQGNDVLMAGSNAPGNAYDLYYLSGGGGTNLFVSNTGDHVFDGSNGNSGATVFDATLDGDLDADDTVQYHQDVLGGLTAGDVRAYIDVSTPTITQMNMLSQIVALGLLMNYNFSMTVDPFATNGGILVDSQNAAANIDGHDIIVVNPSGVSSIPNIDFNEAANLMGMNYDYVLYNGPVSSSSSVAIMASAGSDALMVGGTDFGSDYTLTGSDGNDILQGGVNEGAGTYTLDGGAGSNILIGGDNTSSGNYTLNGSAGDNVLVGGNNTSTGIYTLMDTSAGYNIFFAGANTGGGVYIFDNSAGTGVDMLSYIKIGAGVTVNLGITGVDQDTGGDGTNELFGTFNILQGSNFDDNLSFTQSVMGANGGPVGGPITGSISSETIEGMDGNDVIMVSSTATGGSGSVGNEAIATTAPVTQVNAQVILASDTLDAGTGTGGQVVNLIGTAYGDTAVLTFGNYASDLSDQTDSATAISAQVNIHDNILASDSTITSDTMLIEAYAFGGSGGATQWDDSTVNTGGNVADGANSEAISAQALVENNDLTGGAAGASITIDAEATGGNTGPIYSLYANQALDGATAISGQVTVDGNHLDGYGDLAGDTLHIIATATGGSTVGGSGGGFTANVSGFISTPGGTAISAQAIVDNNQLTEHGTADATLTIDATAIGGNGNYYANYAYDGTVVSADVHVDNNTLTAGSGNDILTIDAEAYGGSGNNNGPGTIDTNMVISGNTLTGGTGNDTLELLINAHPGTIGGSSGAEQLVAQNNLLIGGDGNNTLIFDNAALLANGQGNILDGGIGGFNTLIQQIPGASLDLTASGVADGTATSVLQNIERIDLTGNGNNTLILDGMNVDNLNASHELFVKGDAGDTASIGMNWTQTGTITGAAAGDSADAAVSFAQYTQGIGADTVHLYIDTAMTVTHS